MTLPPLTPEQQVKPRHFELRISLLFAALFVPMGVHLPYFPLWLEAKGFDPEQIAVILSAPMFLRVITTPLIYRHGRSGAGTAPTSSSCLRHSALLLSLGYFLEPTYLTVLAVSLALAVVWTPHSPIANSMALVGRPSVRLGLCRRCASGARSPSSAATWQPASFSAADRRRCGPGDHFGRAARLLCRLIHRPTPRQAAPGRRRFRPPSMQTCRAQAVQPLFSD